MSRKKEPDPENLLAMATKLTFEMRANPITNSQTVEDFDIEQLQASTIFARRGTIAARELRDVRRKKTAVEAIAGFRKGVELYGFTKGQFSMLDLLAACFGLTGPARLSISTWTASQAEIVRMIKMRDEGQILSARWLFDRTFAQRDAAAAYHIRDHFGADSIRITQNHAKFTLFENEEWRLVLRTSMNLNMNPRFEDFTLAHDPELADFIGAILDEIWNRQHQKMLKATHGDIARNFREL